MASFGTRSIGCTALASFAQVTEQVLTTVRKRSRAGAAVVVVLHDLGLAAAYADRAYVLADGRIRGAGPPAEVLPHPHTGTPLVLPRRLTDH